MTNGVEIMMHKENKTMQVNMIIKSLRLTMDSGPIVFVVGAGISRNPPASLFIWDELRLKVISNLTMTNPTDRPIIDSAAKTLRTEVFFQVLYDAIGEMALVPLGVLDPIRMRKRGVPVKYNSLHEFLARKLHEGHIVLTTNQDNFIEEAYRSIFGEPPKVYISDRELGSWYKLSSEEKKGAILKIHGSFVDIDGRSTEDSIIATVNEAGRAISSEKREVIELIAKEYPVLVLGYAGLDDHDLYQLWASAGIGSEKQLYWISHRDDNEIVVLTRKEIEKERDDENEKPAYEREWMVINPDGLLLDRPEGKGIKIYARTSSFIPKLEGVKAGVVTEDNREAYEQVTGDFIGKWARSLSPHQLNLIFGGILDRAGGFDPYANQARYEIAKKFFEDAHNLQLESSESELNFKRGVLNYKQETPPKWIEAERLLKHALGTFQQLSQQVNIAKTQSWLGLVYRRLRKRHEAIGMQLMSAQIFSSVASLSKEHCFDLARSLNRLGLALYDTVDDLVSIPSNTPIRESSSRRLALAERLCQLSLEFKKKIGDVPGESQSYNALGLIKYKRDEPDKAIEYHLQNIALSGKSRFNRESYQSHQNLALAYRAFASKFPEKEEQLSNAEKTFTDALRCNLGKRQKRITLFNRGVVRRLLGDLENSRNDLEEARDLLSEEKISDKWHHMANIKTQLGLVYGSLGCSQEFLDCFRSVLLGLYKDEKKGGSDDTIKQHPYGVQNFEENLSLIQSELEKRKSKDECRKLLEEAKAQAQRIPSLRSLADELVGSELDSDIENLLNSAKAVFEYWWLH